jgi:hypothetical protein
VPGCARSTTAITRGLKALLFAGCGFAAAPAGAALIVLTDGATIKVASYESRGDQVLLQLPSGGSITLSIERIDRAVPDEVESDATPPPPPPPSFNLRFVEGHTPPETPFGGPIFEVSRRHGLNPELVAAVAKVESRFRPKAISKAGARGLLQVMPSTGLRLGFRPADLFDPQKNLDAGAKYLRELADRFGDDLSLVLAAYNAGEGAVDRFGGVPPYHETYLYLERVYSVLGLSFRSGT